MSGGGGWPPAPPPVTAFGPISNWINRSRSRYRVFGTPYQNDRIKYRSLFIKSRPLCHWFLSNAATSHRREYHWAACLQWVAHMTHSLVSPFFIYTYVHFHNHDIAFHVCNFGSPWKPLAVSNNIRKTTLLQNSYTYQILYIALYHI